MSKVENPTLEEMLEEGSKWWKQRYEQARQQEGWGGRDLRDQQTLFNTVAGMEEDITFLLRYVRTLTLKLAQQDTRSTQKPAQGKQENAL